MKQSAFFNVLADPQEATRNAFKNQRERERVRKKHNERQRTADVA